MGSWSPPTIDQDRLTEICARYGIGALWIFGSVARGQAGPSSDVDLLYELAPGRHLGWEIEDLSDELAELFQRPVDLISRRAVNQRIRAAVYQEARPFYPS